MPSNAKNKFAGTYIDLFSGCGGLSLGLGNAGWQGVFAVEKDSMAFETFKFNMIDGQHSHFKWPKWLPKQATTIQTLLSDYGKNLKSLKNKVDLIAGGPPCQGFSLAGMRDPKDPRNKLSEEYVKMVDIIRPKFLLLENVKGFNTAFKNGKGESKRIPHSEIVRAALEKIGYVVDSDLINSQDFGVPQQRNRFIMIGIRKDLFKDEIKPIHELKQSRVTFLKNKGLPLRPITVKEAIIDLETNKNTAKLIKHSGSGKSSFKKLAYKKPRNPNKYLKLMLAGEPNSLRLARHNPSTIEKFKLIQKLCTPGKSLSDEQKAIIGTKKQVRSVLDPKKPSKTLTTLPDDLLHYSEPRILTVRESARIQSFPDSFVFKGKYTTGGDQRKKECPRYTQVGNAVPPLLGEALGRLLKGLLHGNTHSGRATI